jgi:hypothetical protein
VRLAFAVLAACAHATPVTATATAAGPDVPYAPPGPGTAVVTLPAHVATAVVDGPFSISTINPGGSLELAVAPTHDCTTALTWFSYSGGGVAVNKGQTLCARSSSTTTNGFSGHD